MHVLRVNNMHMRETPENTLNNYIRAEGPVATVLGQEPALSNASEQPLWDQPGMASLLTVELDSGALFLEQDKIVPCPVTNLWQSSPSVIHPVFCPGVSSKLVAQLLSSMLQTKPRQPHVIKDQQNYWTTRLGQEELQPMEKNRKSHMTLKTYPGYVKNLLRIWQGIPLT